MKKAFLIALALTPTLALAQDPPQKIDVSKLPNQAAVIDNVVVLEHGDIIFNRNMAEISEKLAFEYNLAGVPAEEVLYAEEMQGRKAGIVKNIAGHDARVDLELLFNGIVKNAAGINAHFANYKYEY